MDICGKSETWRNTGIKFCSKLLFRYLKSISKAV